MIDLSKEQSLCEDLRRGAPDHTYQTDEEVVLSWKRTLDLNMGISFPDTQNLLRLVLRADTGGTLSEQKSLLAMFLRTVPASRCDICEGDGGSRTFKTLSCDNCLGTGIRLTNTP